MTLSQHSPIAKLGEHPGKGTRKEQQVQHQHASGNMAILDDEVTV